MVSFGRRRRRNPLVAAVLNGAFWGTGYLYAGRRVVLGICMYAFVMSAVVSAAALTPRLFIYENTEHPVGASARLANGAIYVVDNENNVMLEITSSTTQSNSYIYILGTAWAVLSVAFARDAYTEVKNRNKEIEARQE